MSIASATAKSGPYVGNGVTVAFAVGFACQAATDLVVVRTDALDVDTTLTYVTDYSVVLNADQVASPGGTVTMAVAPAVGLRITVLRNVALTQGSQLPNQGAWYPKVVENALDKLTMIVQQLSEAVSRSVRVGVTSDDPSVFVAAILTAASNAEIAASSAAAAAASAASIALPSFPGNALRALRVNAAATAWEFFDALSRAGGVLTGALDEALGANIASAATLNLTTATGNLVHVTGSVGITDITLAAGAQRTVVFDGTPILTHSATLLLPGAANIIVAAGDRMIVRGEAAGVIVVSYTRANGAPLAPPPRMKVSDRKASGTTGGSATPATMVTRTLNTVEQNSISGASLASNQVTLPAGTYRFRGRAPSGQGGLHQSFFYNVTDAANVCIGSSAASPTNGVATTDSVFSGEVTIATSKVFTIRHYITTAGGANLGYAVSSGQLEVYAELEIEKVV